MIWLPKIIVNPSLCWYLLFQLFNPVLLEFSNFNHACQLLAWLKLTISVFCIWCFPLYHCPFSSYLLIKQSARNTDVCGRGGERERERERDFIKFSWEFCHAPPRLLHIVDNLYTNLSASISIPAGTTRAILLKTSLYQGDPLSVTIFNTVMNIYLDGLKRLYTAVWLQVSLTPLCLTVCGWHMPHTKWASFMPGNAWLL